MGCDYYIQKVLRIYFEDDYLCCIVGSERGYYMDLYDEDEEDYELKVNEYTKECLTPKMEPIILYNGSFNKSSYETKYKSIVENFMNDCGKKFSDITKIIKIEDRYENRRFHKL